MACSECERLRDEVAYLKSELGLQQDADVLARLSKAMRARNDGLRWTWQKATGSARIVARLYAVNGRPLSRAQLMDAAPAKTPVSDDRWDNIIDVWVCFARKALGKDAIDTVHGLGYKLSDVGMVRVAEIVEGTT